MRLPEKPILTLALVCGVVAAAVGAAGSFFMLRAEAWMPFAFQALVVVAGVFGALAGAGRFRSGPSLAMLCIAGTLFAPAVLGYYGAGGSVGVGDLLRLRPSAFSPGRLPTWAMVGEVGLSGVFGLCSALLALNRKPEESWRRLFVGIALAAPLVVAAGVLVATPLGGRIASMHWLVSGSLLIVGFLVFVGLASASAHQIINAFAAGLPDYTKKPGSSSG